MTKESAQIYQIKVTLNDTHPPIWRRIWVPANTTLARLHDILQIAMGWTDSHLHQFSIHGERYGDARIDETGDLGFLPEQRYQLSQVMTGSRARFEYQYDFGDSWDHTLLVEKILPLQPGMRATPARCLAGQRASPPEDVGGVWGYQEFLEALADPSHPEHDEYLEWVGGAFDPEAFDPDEVNAKLRGLYGGNAVEANVWSAEEPEPPERQIDQAGSWAKALPADQRVLAEGLPLRRDMLTVLTYLRENRVNGTQSTGNLPLKAVREICARFVVPPNLEDRIGDHVYQARSETDVWPLLFLHALAVAAGWLTGGPARRWRLTQSGERMLSAATPEQVWLMLATWWTRVDWAMAWPWQYGDGDLPEAFTQVTLRRLLALPVGELTAFDTFADQMVTSARLIWRNQDPEIARVALHGLVASIVITPLRDFGILETKYQAHRTLGAGYRELVSFRVTSFGHGLLRSIGKTAGRK